MSSTHTPIIAIDAWLPGTRPSRMTETALKLRKQLVKAQARKRAA